MRERINTASAYWDSRIAALHLAKCHSERVERLCFDRGSDWGLDGTSRPCTLRFPQVEFRCPTTTTRSKSEAKPDRKIEACSFLFVSLFLVWVCGFRFRLGRPGLGPGLDVAVNHSDQVENDRTSWFEFWQRIVSDVRFPTVMAELRMGGRDGTRPSRLLVMFVLTCDPFGWFQDQAGFDLGLCIDDIIRRS